MLESCHLCQSKGQKLIKKTQQSPVCLYHGPFVVTRTWFFYMIKNLSIVLCTLERIFAARPWHKSFSVYVKYKVLELWTCASYNCVGLRFCSRTLKTFIQRAASTDLFLIYFEGRGTVYLPEKHHVLFQIFCRLDTRLVHCLNFYFSYVKHHIYTMQLSESIKGQKQTKFKHADKEWVKLDTLYTTRCNTTFIICQSNYIYCSGLDQPSKGLLFIQLEAQNKSRFYESLSSIDRQGKLWSVS